MNYFINKYPKHHF